ncbi:MAG: response regulator, partial [Acidobacteriota bacterium]
MTREPRENSGTLRALIVDDERLAREKLRRLLEEPGAGPFVVVGEAANGPEAVEKIRRERPDLVFLDVQMPGMDGFAVIEKLPAEDLPAIVFVTAHDEYAIRAFEVEAVDYLLKPFDRLRLKQTLERVRRQLGDDRGVLLDKLRRLVAASADPGAARPLRRLAIKSSGRIQSLPIEEVSFFEAADNYLKVHAGKSVHWIREALSDLERRLDADCFIRIHRSAIVRIDAIREVESLFHGDYNVVLKSGERLAVGRKYRDG